MFSSNMWTAEDTNGNAQHYSLSFAVRVSQEVTHSAVKAFERTTQLMVSEGKPILVWWLLQFICLHV